MSVKKKTAGNRLIAFLLVIVNLFVFSLPSFSLESDIKADINVGNFEETVENSYENYISENSSAIVAANSVKVPVNASVKDTPITVNAVIPSDGLYNLGLSYIVTDEGIGEFVAGFKINGNYPFSESSKLSFPRMWTYDGQSRTDGLGNEFTAQQVPFKNYCFNYAYDITKSTYSPYCFYLKAGSNTITIVPQTGNADIEYIEFSTIDKPSSYKQPSKNEKIYNGKSIIIEGELPSLKNSYWISTKNDNSSNDITPISSSKSLINYIGGDNWKTTGDTIFWETPELSEGYYQLGISFRQSAVVGGKVFRQLTVDGKVPFEEASNIGFSYSDEWQSSYISDDNGNPYLIYLPAGKHTIGLTVVPGRMSEVCESLKRALANISSLYIDITMIVGETVDIYRDYDLFSQIPNMEERLNEINKELKSAEKTLQDITGKKSGSNSSVIKNMIRVVEQMLNNRYTAHRYKSEYYNQYSAVAAVLYEMKNMPLDVDKIVLTAPEQKIPFEKSGIFSKVRFSVEKFVYSFINDYNSISVISDNSVEPVTIWVNWGRDQAQVLNSLTQSTFTEETGIPVNVQLVNASIVQAVLSGKGPDCILQHTRSEPVNLAMRGVLYDLTKFNDLDVVLKRFHSNAELPYRYKDGLYALPDTQGFFLMFYRKDILEQMDIPVPDTWDKFKEVTKLLARSNLTAWLPNNPATDVAQANAGVGSINMFPSLLMQKGLELYAEDGGRTNLSNMDVMVTFGEWTDLYRKLKLPRAMDFYNRFRTGTCPIGISTYTMYTTLKAAAPEIDGLWSVAQIPGTELEDGSVCRISSGSGTACAILKNAKNPQNAWKFLKWWTDADTQLSYSNEVESILGPTGRVAVSNVNAFSNMDWDAEMYPVIKEAWNNVKEIPEYPGSYYVSRSIYQSFWNVVENNMNPKDMLLEYGKQADMEIKRKWNQYENR